MPRYSYQPFDTHRPPGLDAPEPLKPVAIIGAGPIGLTMAIDLALRGVKTVVLDDNNVVSVGSRAICWSKRSLEIFHRLGVGERMLDKGVTWNIGRLFYGNDEVYSFDLLPEDGHKYPAFINLQQYYVEQYLVERAQEFPDLIDLRFNNKVINHSQHEAHVSLDIETPDGNYSLDSQYLIACDGANSPTRKRMALPFEGQTFEEQFLIVDVEMEDSPFQSEQDERWFWFDPEFHPGRSALLHKQPDNIYRIDLQLDVNADAKEELREDKVIPRIKAVVGNKPFEIDWQSVYKFRCARLDRFVHDRVIFVGDSAHVVSPFGARGGNGGVQDVDNLGWKLARVLNDKAGFDLLETYNDERTFGSDENILNSSRATNFMTPKSPMEETFRTAVLDLATDMPFARRLINSGRLSVPCNLGAFPPHMPGPAKLEAGSAMFDLPLEDGHYLVDVLPAEFCLVGFGDIELPEIAGLPRIGINQSVNAYPCYNATDQFTETRYGKNIACLFRPDGHLMASFDVDTIGSLTEILGKMTID